MNGRNSLSGMSDLIRASNMRWKNSSNMQQTKILFFVSRSPATFDWFNLFSVASFQTNSPPSSLVKHLMAFVGSNPIPMHNCRSSKLPWYPPSVWWLLEWILLWEGVGRLRILGLRYILLVSPLEIRLNRATGGRRRTERTTLIVEVKCSSLKSLIIDTLVDVDRYFTVGSR